MHVQEGVARGGHLINPCGDSFPSRGSLGDDRGGRVLAGCSAQRTPHQSLRGQLPLKGKPWRPSQGMGFWRGVARGGTPHQSAAADSFPHRTEPAYQAVPVFRSAYFPKTVHWTIFSKTLDLQGFAPPGEPSRGSLGDVCGVGVLAGCCAQRRPGGHFM